LQSINNAYGDWLRNGVVVTPYWPAGLYGGVEMRKLQLDLHPIARNGDAIEGALWHIVSRAEDEGARSVEIIHGKGSSQLKKRVLKFLERPEVKQRYARVVKDKDNSGRLFVYFRK
jgi:DNA-nicking Smr family endonuclease